MSFERKIAAQGLEKVEGPKIEPEKEGQGGAIEVKGGTVNPKDRGHKRWGHTIQHELELRSLITTTQYVPVEGNAAKVALGEWGYHIIRAPGSELIVSVERPTTVPKEQWTNTEKHRYRQWRGFVEIFYPQPTKLQFYDCKYGRSGYKLEGGEAAEVPEGETPPPATPLQLVQMFLDEELGAGITDPVEMNEYLRQSGTADLFLISHNERTGANFVVPLSMGIKNAVDPEVPIDDPVEEEPGDPEDPKPEPPKDPDNPYTDPITGEPLEPTPPPPTKGTLVALHAAGMSQSLDGGATWLFRDLAGLGACKDVAATGAGIFILTEAGKVFYFPTFDAEAQELQLAEFMPEGGLDIPVANGDFETGDLTSWVSTTGDVPRVLNTAQPPQRTGSTYYLTRDWRIVNPQDFSIEQSIELAEDVRSAARLRLSFDALTENQDIAQVEVYDAAAIAVVKPDFAITWDGSKYVAPDFATDPDGNSLNLVAAPDGNPSGGTWQQLNGLAGISVNASQTFLGSLKLRVEKPDGALYDGVITLHISDLDKPGDVRETLRAEGVYAFDLLEGDVVVQEEGEDAFLFLGVQSGIENDDPAGRFNVSFKSECLFTFSAGPGGGLGIRGPGSMPGESEGVLGRPLITAAHSGDEWTTVQEEYLGDIPERIKLVVSGKMVGGYADVYIDNIKLSTVSGTDATGATAIAPIYGKNGGADVYIGDVLVPYIPSALKDPKSKPQALFGPTDMVTMADRASRAGVTPRIASDGNKFWTWDELAEGKWYSQPLVAQGPFVSLICDPFVAVAKSTGAIINPKGLVFGTVEPGSTLSSYRRALVGIATGPKGDIWLIMPDKLTNQAPVKYRSQPKNDAIGNRRSLPMDIGRFIGWAVGVPDFYWNDRIGNEAALDSWKLGGALERPIIKVAETR